MLVLSWPILVEPVNHQPYYSTLGKFKHLIRGSRRRGRWPLLARGPASIAFSPFHAHVVQGVFSFLIPEFLKSGIKGATVLWCTPYMLLLQQCSWNPGDDTLFFKDGSDYNRIDNPTPLQQVQCNNICLFIWNIFPPFKESKICVLTRHGSNVSSNTEVPKTETYW